MRFFLVILLLLPLTAGAVSQSVNVGVSVTSGAGGTGTGGGTGTSPPPPPPLPPPASSQPPATEGAAAVIPPGPEEKGLDLFELLPSTTVSDSLLDRLALRDFVFLQVGSEPLLVDNRGIVHVDGNKYLTIALELDKVPPILKTIGVTIFHPQNPQKVLSFILRSDTDWGAYLATIAPLGEPGFYPFNIHIINYQNQRIKKLSGAIQILSPAAIVIAPLLSQLKGSAMPLALGSGILAGASALIAVAPSAATTLYDFYLLFFRGLGALFSILKTKRQRRPWGTVYDAVTKRPLDPALVTVFRDGREVASAITDLDGRYSFVLPPAQYQLTVKKSNYHFPSRILKDRTEDEMYDNLYFGGPVFTGGAELAALNIPLDPRGFDWNVFVKDRGRYFKFFRRQERLQFSLFNIFYAVGFIIALSLVVGLPNWLNISVFTVYVLLYLSQFLRRRKFKVRVVKKAVSGEPLPFALIRVLLSDLNQEVKRVAADALGRFYLLVRPGTYYLLVEEKNPDGSYTPIFRSANLELPKGVLPGDIVVP